MKYQLNLLLISLAILSLLGILTGFTHYESESNKPPSQARIDQYKNIATIIVTEYSSTGLENLPDIENVKISSNNQDLLDSTDNEHLVYIITFSPDHRYCKISFTYSVKKIDNELILDSENPGITIMDLTVPFKTFITFIIIFSLLFVILCLGLFYYNRKPKERDE